MRISGLVAVELFAFVVVCMLVNFQAENSVAHSINLLLSGVIYGQYSSGGVFIVQVLFAVFNILSIVYLISLLAVEL